ncbi:uncharacterized protein B0P05DRAFT_543000 [Gilbertella persicaria]|uniref:uncharacterized protein n=1 Tax=Gilbertella persicaria TaxID=101096 RepID=UPI00221FD632|nr:uncharacterized protein B0P05DRAFT_543000 [Gilbertella persicaria]KAI8078225.1 hypothetical protein B0P05DRAFT_543000 [Gilbertella persicaria]
MQSGQQLLIHSIPNLSILLKSLSLVSFSMFFFKVSLYCLKGLYSYLGCSIDTEEWCLFSALLLWGCLDMRLR